MIPQERIKGIMYAVPNELASPCPREMQAMQIRNLGRYGCTVFEHFENFSAHDDRGHLLGTCTIGYILETLQ